MECRILDGKSVASILRDNLKASIQTLKKEKDIIPGIAFIMAGDDDASMAYTKNAQKLCLKMGMHAEDYYFENGDTNRLIELIHILNGDKNINGILIQMPLPKNIDEKKVREAISPDKDVDGISPLNCGRFYSGERCFIPCTPKGILKLIDYTKENICGKHAVVVGRSSVVGKPAAALLLQKNATVTVCHSKTKNLSGFTKNADIIISATGKPGLIRGDMIKEGALVIDAGTTYVDGKLVGDVNFEEAKEIASWITPVPGGVGAMTTTMLVENTLEACLNNVY